mmetsp:Transcript_15434/g.25012  ORF Transcript_15434/g.25012 Transcript_15434/m.25012 type:complete len:150 (+) Transcript_15434:34-483(+)
MVQISALTYHSHSLVLLPPVMTTNPIDRRERFILAVSASFGLGTILVPQWFTANFLNCAEIESPGLQGLCDAAVITLSTAYAVGCLTALVLNVIIPADDEDDVVIMDGDDTASTKKLVGDDTENPKAVVDPSSSSDNAEKVQLDEEASA